MTPETEATAGHDAAETPQSLLAAWRAQGAARCDAVRFRYLESLASRTAAQQGTVRRLLDDKLARAMADYRRRLEHDAEATVPTTPTARVARGPLAALRDQLDAAAAPAAPAADAADGVAERPDLPPLKSVSRFRDTWSRLRADRRLQQSQAALPGNAGPLNSQHLVHRSLNLMHAASPHYLNQFMVYVDALAALDQVLNAPASPAPAARATSARKAARAKSSKGG